VVLLASRKSPLALAQVKEILEEMQKFHPKIEFETIQVDTTGDIDLQSSLRTMGSTDFFTKQIDELLLSSKCDAAIHSAKDLPNPLHPLLEIVAITKGVDACDVIVMKDGMKFATLPTGAKVGACSLRRIEAISKLRSDVEIVDIRGNIGQRLEKLFVGQLDAVVMAKAALIRLDLLHLNYEEIQDQTAPLQGRLAVVARRGDKKIEDLFACIKVAQ